MPDQKLTRHQKAILFDDDLPKSQFEKDFELLEKFGRQEGLCIDDIPDYHYTERYGVRHLPDTVTAFNRILKKGNL